MSDQPMTDDGLRAIEARLNVATPGQWDEKILDGDDEKVFFVVAVTNGAETDVICNSDYARDNAFIAHAPDDVRHLVSEVRRLRARVIELEAQRSPFTSCSGCIDDALDALAADPDVQRELDVIRAEERGTPPGRRDSKVSSS